MLQRTKLPDMSPKTWRSLLLLGLLGLVPGCADLRDLFTPYQPRPAEVQAMLAWPHRPAPLDVAVVLGCPADDDGQASLCELCRIKSAVRAYREGRVRNLLFSGNAAHSPFVEADVMADLAEQNGVPKDHVLREPRAYTTWQNLRYAKQLLDEKKLQTVLIVSTSDHLPRARRIASFYRIDDAHTDYLACDTDLTERPMVLAHGEDPERTRRLIERMRASLPRR